MNAFWNENLDNLRNKNPMLYQKVFNHTPENVGEIIPTQTVPTLRFNAPGGGYIYSPEDPIAELKAGLSILKKKEVLNKTICIFTGMGLGYGQLLVSEMRKDIFRIIILEPCLDLFVLALKHVDLRPLLTSDRVYIFAGDIDWNGFNSIINDKTFETDFLFSDYNPLIHWRPDLYGAVKDKASACASKSISGLGVLTRFGELLFKNRMSNLTLLRDANLLDDLSRAFKGKPALLISAGPSLGKSIEALKKASGKAVLIAVDSAVVPLQTHGIIPDIVTTLDFRELNSEKLSPDVIKEQAFSLVSSITASSLTARRLAFNHLFFSFQENDTQDWLMQALGVKQKMQAVNSVAALSLGVAQVIEADPIIFVGYDFALTSKETDHVKGTVFSWNWHQNNKHIQVQGVNGLSVNTLDFLYEFKQGVERLIQKDNRDYINATAAGAHIEGTRVKDLNSVIDEDLTQPVAVKNVIDGCARSRSNSDAIAFIKKARTQIAAAENTHKHVRSIISQNDKVKAFIRKNKKQSGKINHISKVPKNIQSARLKREKLYKNLIPFVPIEEIAAYNIEKASQVHNTRAITCLFEQLEKESEVMAYAMEGHHQGLLIFKQEVGDLVSYLEKEDQVIDRIEKNRLSEKDMVGLAGLYLKNKDAAKALLFLKNCQANYPEYTIGLVMMGECYAVLLDYKNAFKCWDSVEKQGVKFEKMIRKKRDELATYWIQRGLEDASILDLCLRRGFQLCNEKEICQKQKKQAWPACRRILNRMIKRNQLERAKSLILLWQPIRDCTPEWKELYDKIVLEND